MEPDSSGLLFLDRLPPVTWWGYKVDPYIEAACLLQRLGETEALKEMACLAPAFHVSPASNDAFMVLCRMLFVKKADQEFRGPGLGAPWFLGETDFADWPLAPIELVHGVPFLIVRGYSCFGRMETGREYLTYCLESCTWSDVPYSPRNREQKIAALTELLALAASKTNLEAWEVTFLTEQIE